ncbi:MAG: pyruvate dehydrogenase (acetyl-transferring), homodimeric type, partial [Pseudomonadota bacterium]
MIEDEDPIETREWLDALDGVVKHGGKDRARSLLLQVAEHAVDAGVRLPTAITTPFRNTINPAEQRAMPGDLFMERRIRSLIRWNALAMVMRANDNDE